MAQFTSDIEKLEKILPEYLTNRTKGMHAGDIAEKLDIPLKDVISFLIEKDILKGEQIDLELARVILAKNPYLKNAILERINIPFTVLDRALATQDENTLREIWKQFEESKISPIFSGFVVFLFALNFPYNVVLTLCTVLLTLLCKKFLEKEPPKSNVEAIINMFKEI
jgi:hypothetical protein